MQFVTLKPDEFTKFATKHKNRSFLQTRQIAELREKNGWTAYYFGVRKDSKLIAAAMVVAKPTFLGKSTFYVPGGPLLDYEDSKLTDFFIKNLKNYAKSHNGYVLHIEPNYELIQRDRDGEVVKDGFNHQKALKNLQNLGFRSTAPDNPKYQFVLDLKGQNEKELFASFKQNTRNLINRTERKGVKIRELKREELPIFKQITEETSERRHFDDKSLDYYQTMYDLFAKKGEVKFIVAKTELENSATRGLPEVTTEDEGASPVTTGASDPSRESTVSSSVPLSAAMFMTYGEEVVYLFSGSDEKYMKEYNAQYAIQWYMIKYALKHDFKRYNFYGIQGLPDPKKKGYGIYLFKKGFTTPEDGRVVELLGAFELPLSPLYHLHQLLAKLKAKIH